MKFLTELKVGITIVLALVALGYMAMRINIIPLFGDKGYTYYADFDSVNGIILKTPVTVAGITIGYVTEIEFVKGKARLTIGYVDKKIMIYENASANILDKGVLGEKFIQLDAGDSSFKRIPNKGMIKKTVSVSQVDNLFNQLSGMSDMLPMFTKIAGNISQMTENLSKLIGQDSTMGRLDTISKNMELFTEDVSRFTHGNVDNIQKIVDNFSKIAAGVDSLMQEGNNGVKDTISNLKESTVALHESLAVLRRVMEKVDKGEGTVGRLLNDDALITKLDKTMDGVSTMLNAVNQLETRIGYRGEYLTDTSFVQNAFYLTIKPRPNKYFLLEFIDSRDDATSATDESTLKISAQIAKRYYDLNMRAGFIRSRAGFGVDYYLFKDIAALSCEVFDFGRDVRPHLRSYLTLNITDLIQLTGGFDDLINNSRTRPSDAFVGLGIHFTDEDIKSFFSLFATASKL